MRGEYILIILALLWVIRELAIGGIVWYQRLRLRQLLRVETTRRYFAEARNQLVHLALQGEIDVNSATFQSFYLLQTRVMRRPEQYRQLSAIVLATLLRPASTQTDSPLRREAATWGPTVKEVVKATADAFQHLLFQHSRPLRILAQLESRFRALTFLVYVLRLCQKTIQQAEEKKRPEMAEIREAQRCIYALAA